VLADTHWEFGPGRKELREIKGPPEWRLGHFEPEPWVTVDVAIRYLQKLKAETRSEAIKRNAERSIAILRKPHKFCCPGGVPGNVAPPSTRREPNRR
jgi:hypothetical protein